MCLANCSSIAHHYHMFPGGKVVRGTLGGCQKEKRKSSQPVPGQPLGLVAPSLPRSEELPVTFSGCPYVRTYLSCKLAYNLGQQICSQGLRRF